jgi:hypothetical protein
LLVQKKVTKVNDTPYRLFPALLSFMGVNRKLASLKQPLAENPHEAEQRRRVSRGMGMYFESVALVRTPSLLALLP